VPDPSSSLPIIDIEPLRRGGDTQPVAASIATACRDNGFFYVVGHGVSETLQRDLEEQSRAFFALPPAAKLRIAMANGGRAWRGFFPVGEELTSGQPDRKEGLYFGAELGAEHPLVRAGTPMHGRNLFPQEVPELRATVLSYMEAMTILGHTLLSGIALSLNQEPTYFYDRYTTDPFILFRIFHYPPPRAGDEDGVWGVGEHTDYGVLTILKQDEVGGLQIKSRAQWIEAPPLPGSFVCNIGDMLERMTAGHYRSTPHRVRNTSTRSRLSFPFFFDPSFHAVVRPLQGLGTGADDHEPRWDQASVHDFDGPYGDYVLSKVGKVFPELRRAAL